MGNDHFYTLSVNEARLALDRYGYVGEGSIGHAYGIQIAGTVPLFRLYNRTVNDHFYTTSAAERDNAVRSYGYLSEGIACFVFMSAVLGSLPVYRLKDLATGNHWFTTSAAERDAALLATLPSLPGIPGQPPRLILPGRGGLPVRPAAPRHRDEGIACYVLADANDHALTVIRQKQIDSTHVMPQRVRGFADIHTHQHANLAFGGKAFVGAAFGPIEQALPHCDYAPGGGLVHGPGGLRDVLGSIRSITSGVAQPGLGLLLGSAIGGLLFLGFGPLAAGVGGLVGAGVGSSGHLVGGNPEFDGWPRWNNLTHQAMYQSWLRRALDGGLKLIVMFAVNNEFAADHVEKAPGRSSDDMEAVGLQIASARAMEAAIDEESGGRGLGWYRVVESPQQARDVIQAGKLAVVLGIEVDFLFSSRPDKPPTPDEVLERLDCYYDLGVRHVFPIHFTDNAFGGAAFQNNLIGDPAVREFNRDGVDLGPIGWPSKITTRPAPGTPYEYRGGRVNVLGLTELGKFLIEALMSKGMIIDVDHMSIAAARDTLSLAETSLPYPIVSSHTGFIDISHGDKRHEGNMSADEAERIRRTGGMLACILNQGSFAQVSTWHGAGQTSVEHTSGGTAETWAQAYLYAIEKMHGGPVGFGSDFNGMINPTGPRFGSEAAPGGPPPPLGQGVAGPNNPVEYPFTAVATGASLDRSVVGRKTFDINTDGLAHVGMFPDFVADLQKIGVTDNDLEPLLNSAEGYLQIWELAEQYRHPRPAAPFVGIPKWSQLRSGFLRTSEVADTISYQVVPNTVAVDEIECVLCLEGPVKWPKQLMLRAYDGQFPIDVADHTRTGRDGLYRYQLDTGSLQFRKAKGPFKLMADVLRLEDLSLLPPGARVTFTWSRD